MFKDMDEVQWLSDDELTAWVRFTAVLELLPAALDAQLNTDAQLTHFEYFCLAILSEAPEKVLRTSALAARTNATLPRLSRVITQLEKSRFVERLACPEDGRVTNIALTEAGWQKVVATAPGHVGAVRRLVIDALTPAQVQQLSEMSAAMLSRLDPEGRMLATTKYQLDERPSRE